MKIQDITPEVFFTSVGSELLNMQERWEYLAVITKRTKPTFQFSPNILAALLISYNVECHTTDPSGSWVKFVHIHSGAVREILLSDPDPFPATLHESACFLLRDRLPGAIKGTIDRILQAARNRLESERIRIWIRLGGLRKALATRFSISHLIID